MDKVFELYVAEDDLHRWTSLTLPASIYELVDMLEQIGSQDIDSLYFEVDKYHSGKELAPLIDREITIRELNLLAWKIAEMDENQETILEGLARMERRKQGADHLPYTKLLQLAENTDRCHLVEEARNDSQLGRFYAENGFVEGLEDLPDNLFEMLDFEKIGREMRLADGGIFASAGYVVRHDELRALSKMPGFDLEKPPYTILLEIRKAGEKNGPWLNIELPLLQDKLGEFQEKYPRGEYMYSCIDCAVPFFGEYISEMEAELCDIGNLAQRMDLVQKEGLLPKYKAVLRATGCRDIELAVELCRSQVLAEYRLLPFQDMPDPAAYAANWLEEKLGKDAKLVMEQSMEDLGRCLMERRNIKETDYGFIQRTDGQPVQWFGQKPEQGQSFSMTM